MNVQIIEQKEKPLHVAIYCSHINHTILNLKSHIESFDMRLQAKKSGETRFVNPSDILYFESVDNRTFLYTQKDVLELKQRLYELEESLSPKDFIRISKSLIININKVSTLKPELNRTILATMCNGELLYISRKYVPAVRKLLSI